MALEDNSRGRTAVIISSVFTGFAALSVLLRLYTRFVIVRCPGVEDYLIFVALLTSIGLTICIGIQAQYGMGQHIWQLQPSDSTHSLKAFYASLIVYYLSLGLTKLSILIQYQRVFSIKKFRVACWVTMSVVVVYAFWTVFSSIFGCKPIQAFWTLKQPFTCLDQFAVWFFNGGMNILSDFAIILLPMPVIRGLKLPRRQKQALIGIFAIGGFVCLVSILRLQSLVAISNSSDPTYDNPPAATWSSVETSVGIICACLPGLRPLVIHYMPSIFMTQSSRSALSGGGTKDMHRRHSRYMLSGRTGATTKGSADDEVELNKVEDRDSIIRVVTEFEVTVEDQKRRHSDTRSLEHEEV